MWLGKIFGNKVATALVDMLFLSDNLNPSATARGRWFHNIHVFVAFHLSFVLPALVVFREYVRWWGDVILSAMAPTHLEDISPKVVFPPELPAAREMIDLLILIDVFKFAWFDNACP